MSEANNSSDIGAYLRAQRAAILDEWRDRALNDVNLSAPASLNITQFIDHIPIFLDALEDLLQSSTSTGIDPAIAKRLTGATGHGLLRWQQGYNLTELISEWGHLQLVLLELISKFEPAPEAQPRSAEACTIVAQLCTEGVNESVRQYIRLQQAEAAGRLRDLELTLDELKRLEGKRALFLREITHDLRGQLGVVENVSNIIQRTVVGSNAPGEFLGMLQKGILSLQEMLSDLALHARLEAGEDRRRIEEFNVSATLQDLLTNLQPSFSEKGLSLTAEGPESLVVFGDSLKMRRIIQNLLINALKYTSTGGASVSWAKQNETQWSCTITDTGPGFPSYSAAPLAAEIEKATEEGRLIESSPPPSAEPARYSGSMIVFLGKSEGATGNGGEGIGLSIVARLCELLDATLELTTTPGVGSTFTVTFPIQYPE